MGRGSERPAPRTWDPPPHEIYGWIDGASRAAARKYGLDGRERQVLVQRLFLRVWQSLDRFTPDGPATLRTWVNEQAKWGIADYQRERAKAAERGEQQLRHDVPAPETPLKEACRRELRSALRACLEQLSPTQRARFLESSKAYGTRPLQRELAREWGVQPATLKKEIRKSRIALRRCLHARGFSPEGWLFEPSSSSPPTVQEEEA